MVDGDAIQPGADGRFPPELIELPERLEEHVVGGVFSFLGIAQQAKGEVIDGPAMLVIDRGKIRRPKVHALVCLGT